MKPGMWLVVPILAVAMAACDGLTDPEDRSDVDPVPIPDLISPAEGAVLDNGCSDQSDWIIWEFDWSDVQGATGYHLFVKGRNAIYPVIDRAVGESEYRFQSIGYIIGQNQLGWRWRVRARIDTTWMDWSEERSFDVEPLNSDCM